MGCHPGRDKGALEGGGSDHLISRRQFLRSLGAGIDAGESALGTQFGRDGGCKIGPQVAKQTGTS